MRKARAESARRGRRLAHRRQSTSVCEAGVLVPRRVPEVKNDWRVAHVWPRKELASDGIH